MRTAVPARGRAGRRGVRSADRQVRPTAHTERGTRSLSRRCDPGRAGPWTPAGPGGRGWPRRGWCSRSSLLPSTAAAGRSVVRVRGARAEGCLGERSATSRGLRGEGADYRTPPRLAMRRSTSSRCMASTVRGRPGTCQTSLTIRTLHRRDVHHTMLHPTDSTTGGPRRLADRLAGARVREGSPCGSVTCSSTPTAVGARSEPRSRWRACSPSAGTTSRSPASRSAGRDRSSPSRQGCGSCR